MLTLLLLVPASNLPDVTPVDPPAVSYARHVAPAVQVALPAPQVVRIVYPTTPLLLPSGYPYQPLGSFYAPPMYYPSAPVSVCWR